MNLIIVYKVYIIYIILLSERLVSGGNCCKSTSGSDSKNDPAYGSTDNSTQSSPTDGNAQSTDKTDTVSVDNSQSTDKAKSGTDSSGGKTQSGEKGSIQTIVLNIGDTFNNNYNYQLTDTHCVYTPKTGYGFASAKSCNKEFWTAENNQHSTKVEYNHKDKTVTVHINDGSTKKYKMESSGCTELSEGNQKSGTGQKGTGGGTTGTGTQPSGGTPATN